MGMIRVFVYGTLKPGAVNHWVCARQVLASQPAIAFGRLYSLPFGYPALTPGDQPVQGFVLSFAPDSDILPLLDAFEQHDPQVFQRFAPGMAIHAYGYQRQQISVFNPQQQPIGQAWAYRMTTEQVERLGGVPIMSGQWMD